MGTSSIFAAAKDGMRTISGPLLDLSLSRGKSQSYAVIRSIAPVGIVVPLHGHDEPETMVVVEGVLEAWLDGAWNRYKKGEVIDIAANVPHALRNSGHEEVALVLVTTPRMAGFFDEISVSQAQAYVTPERLAHIAKIAAAYGFWSASPEQQAAIGIPSKATRGATLQLPPDCGGWRVGMRLVLSAGLWQKLSVTGSETQ